MQPKFTLKNYGFIGKITALALIFAMSAQYSFSQQGRNPNKGSRPAPTQLSERVQAKQLRGARPASSNDAGITVVSNITTPPSTEAVCTTFTGTVGPADAPIGRRSFRDGVASSCAVPGPCGAAIVGSFQHKVLQWTNPLSTTQCVTVTYSTTSANFTFVTAYNGSFDPNNLCANYLGDPGSSATAGTPIVWSFNAPPSATIFFLVGNVVGGQTADYTIVIDAPVCFAAPCSGTPNPGNTISSVPTVCALTNFTLSLQNPTPGSGVSYQWQFSPDGVTWTPFGTNSPSQTRQQSAPTYYRAIVTCGANSGTSTPVQVLTTPPSGCYCIPPASDCTDDDVITRVRLSTLDNPSGCSPGGYGNYTATVAAPLVYSGAANPITVDVPTVWPENVAVWIDYNQNGAFETTEYTFVGNNNTSGTITNNINIPTTALAGITRMRVRVQFAAIPGPGAACSGFVFGETEDYNVNITPCVQGVFTAHPSNTTAQCSGTATFSVAANGSLLTFRWQRKVGGFWVDLPNGPGVSGATTSTLTLTNIPSSWNGNEFRALMQGGCTAIDFSNPATLTVTPLVATVTPTSATICTGTIQNIRITNVASPVQLINEGFNSVVPLPTGWAAQNNSTPVGITGWFQGNPAVFAAQNGAPDAYIAANFNNVAGANTISNWLMTPQVAIKNGDVLTFWTRTVPTVAFPDRLEVRMSTAGASTNVGATNTSVGDFTTLLLTVNPSLTLAGYPTTWTQYTATISGLAGPTSGRFAFRYFVTSGGPAGANSDYIGIDNVVYTAGAEALGVWTSNPAAPNTMFTDPAATIPYTGTPINGIYVKPTVTTVYTVVYTTSTPCTSAPTSVTVTVITPPTAVVNPANRSACVGGSTTFTAGATGGPFSYQWEVSTNGGVTYTNVPGGTGATLTVSGITQVMNNNLYRLVIGAAPCAGSTTTTAATLTVNPLPVVTITASSLAITPGQPTTITATSSPAALNATSWTWFYNGTQIVTVPPTNTNSITRGIDQLGSYQARVTDVNGCVSVSNILEIGGASSEKLWIYPNPTDGMFQVRVFFEGPYADIRNISIYDESGKLVMRKAFDLYPTQPPYLQMNFDMTAFPAGTYVVKVEEKFTGKIKSGLVVIQ